MQSPDDLEMSRRELLEHVPIEFGQQLAHLSTSPAGLSRGSRFTAKIIGMAGTSPAMTLHVWFDLIGTRASLADAAARPRQVCFGSSMDEAEPPLHVSWRHKPTLQYPLAGREGPIVEISSAIPSSPN